ncbi:MAG: hypothetical protein INF54_14165, partial [Roseomonas sp.]|nr:hypothetical protein [Roseomonas sp.]
AERVFARRQGAIKNIGLAEAGAEIEPIARLYQSRRFFSRDHLRFFCHLIPWGDGFRLLYWNGPSNYFDTPRLAISRPRRKTMQEGKDGSGERT